MSGDSPLPREVQERISDRAGKSCALQAYGDRESWFCAADDYEDELASVLAKLDRLREALETIGTGCENYASRDGSVNCVNAGRTRGAEYGADAWCDRCIAREALSSEAGKR